MAPEIIAILIMCIICLLFTTYIVIGIKLDKKRKNEKILKYRSSKDLKIFELMKDILKYYPEQLEITDDDIYNYTLLCRRYKFTIKNSLPYSPYFQLTSDECLEFHELFENFKIYAKNEEKQKRDVQNNKIKDEVISLKEKYSLKN